jgi:acetoin:2,6-dichlorophenolindophenol oxidoreductase subunit alpha
VYAGAVDATAHIRRTGQPYFMELQTYRVRGHSESDPRSPGAPPEELQHWRARDPLACLQDRLLRAGETSERELQTLSAEIDAEIERALRSARASQCASNTDLFADVYA